MSRPSIFPIEFTFTTSIPHATASDHANSMPENGSPISPRSDTGSPGPPPQHVFPTIPQIPHIVFDPRGDVILALKSPRGTLRFQVNSGILCLCSPVFRAMLGAGSRFKERKALEEAHSKNLEQDINNDATGFNERYGLHEPLEISLIDDDPDALVLALRIIHFHYQWIPTAETPVDQGKLYQLAVICDKYDMKHALLFWFQQYPRVKPLAAQLTTNSGNKEGGDKISPSSDGTLTKSTGRWLFIAYACGDENLFREVSRELILHSRIDDEAALTLPGEILSKTLEFVPQAVLEAIQTQRKQAMDSIIETTLALINKYYKSTGIQCVLKQRTCDATLLGLLLHSFQQIDLVDISVGTTTVTATSKAIAEVASLIYSIKFPDYLPGTNPSCSMCMTSCCKNPRAAPSPIFLSKSYVRCSNCQGSFSPGRLNHAVKCSPLIEFKEKIKGVVGKIGGLEYAQFVGGRSKEHFAGRPASGTNLWNGASCFS